MAEIKLTGVDKVYPGGTHAVHSVDLHIADGEFMIMVGPSGCAKSTILRMIAGLEVPTGGTVEIGGRVVNDVAPKDRDIAMVFQSYALYPHMTVRENMAFGLRLRKMPDSEIDKRVADAARILGLESLLDRLPKAMSGGQRQRVAMGRAIVREPQCFLMDEPLSNLDAKLRVQMRTEIAKLHQRLGVTTVYVTHDQVEAMTLGQRICILRKGVVQQVNTPFEVYQNPANIFVGGFMGSPGMNFMSGHLVLHDGVSYLRLGDHHLPLPASVTARLQSTNDIHGRGVVVGIRPEHLAVTTDADPLAVPTQVELVEAMGAELYAYFTAGVATPDLSALSDTQATAETFVARLPASTMVRGGDAVHLRLDMDELHLFDPQTMLTMLTPVDEGEVRARQLAAAGHASAGSVFAPSHVTAVPSASVQQIQPVVHLHQTFMQPDGVVPGSTINADPAAVAAVFDSPIEQSITLQPLMPGTGIAVGAHGMPGPRFAGTSSAGAASASAYPRPAAAAPIMAAAELPVEPMDMPGEPVMETQQAAEPEVVTEAPRPRGFAARPIGRVAPAPPAVVAEPEAEAVVDVGAASEQPDVVDQPGVVDGDASGGHALHIATTPELLDSTLERIDGTPAVREAVTGFRSALAGMRSSKDAPTTSLGTVSTPGGPTPFMLPPLAPRPIEPTEN